MTTKTTTLGPGSLVFGETGSTTEFAAQLTKCTLKPSDSRVSVLSGGSVADGDYKVEGEIYQDYTDLTSLIVWCHAHSGEQMPFAFIPTTATKLAVKGIVEITEVEFGGDVKKKNTTSFSFKGVDDYEYFDHTVI